MLPADCQGVARPPPDAHCIQQVVILPQPGINEVQIAPPVGAIGASGRGASLTGALGLGAIARHPARLGSPWRRVLWYCHEVYWGGGRLWNCSLEGKKTTISIGEVK